MKVLEKYYKYLQQHIDQDILDDIVPLDITPAAKWFLGESPKEEWRYREDFPCVLPPAPVSWIEYELPSIIRSTEKELARPARHVAVLVMTLEVPEADQKTMLVEDRLIEIYKHFLRKSRITYGTSVQTDNRPDRIRDTLAQQLRCKWVSIWQLWAEPLNHRALVPFVSYAYYLDQNGQLLPDLGLAHVLNQAGKSVPVEHLDHCFADILPSLFGLSLTHCKNVELVERTVPPAIVKARKAKEIPELRFKQLLIKPTNSKRFIDKNKPMSNQQGMLPLHFVRAHFKTYTAERPLMGRHTGTYFWHQTARGNHKYGEVVKEYKIREGEA